MRRLVFLSVVVSMMVAVSGAVLFAVPPGRTLEFTGSPEGTVVFDGAAHSKAVKSCADCHNENLFPEMRKGAATITMKDIREGRYCGACHNGEITFSATENCERCHRE